LLTILIVVEVVEFSLDLKNSVRRQEVLEAQDLSSLEEQR
jgi:hypothetical protein